MAGKIIDWDEFRTLGLELDCHPDDIARLKSENQSIASAAYKVLSSWYDRVVSPATEKWTMLKNALKDLGKDAVILELGIDVLSGEASANVQLALGAGDGPSKTPFGNQPSTHRAIKTNTEIDSIVAGNVKHQVTAAETQTLLGAASSGNENQAPNPRDEKGKGKC